MVQADGSLRIEFEGGALTETAAAGLAELTTGAGLCCNVQSLERDRNWLCPGRLQPRTASVHDPTLTWNTFMGIEHVDVGGVSAVDAKRECLCDRLQLTPVGGAPVNPIRGGNSDAFAAKLNSSGVRQCHTFMGSSSL